MFNDNSKYKDWALGEAKKHFYAWEPLTVNQLDLILKRLDDVALQACYNAGLVTWPKTEEEKERYLKELNEVVEHVNLSFSLPPYMGNIKIVREVLDLFFTDRKKGFPKALETLIFSKKKEFYLHEIRDYFKKTLAHLLPIFNHHITLQELSFEEALVGHLLAYYALFEPPDNDLISVPIFFEDKWRLYSYRLEKITLTPNWLGSPVEAYGGNPLVNAPPLLIFKPTPYPGQAGFFLSVLADFNPLFSVGTYLLWLGNIPLKKWLKSTTEENYLLARLYGLSLGGSLTLLASEKYGDYIESAHAYVTPSLLPWQISKKSPSVHLFVHENDIVSLAGTSWGPDWNVHKVIGSKPLTPFLSHIHVFLAEEEHLILKVKSNLYAKRFYHRLMSVLHILISIPWFITLVPLFLIFLFFKWIRRWLGKWNVQTNS